MKEQSDSFNSVSKQERTKVVHTIKHQILQEWRNLWHQSIHDEQIAEDVARTDYPLLFVERGTIIKATKDYKPPNLQDILERNEKLLGVTLTSSPPRVGGWRKFSRELLSKQPRWRQTDRRSYRLPEVEPRNGSPKKRGRGRLR